MGEKESLLEIRELITAVDGVLLAGSNSVAFTSVVIDSRSVSNQSLFIPLIGELQNGHLYIPQALKNGASVVFVNNDEPKKNIDLFSQYYLDYPDVCFIGVKHTMYALQKAACAYVKKFPDLIKIGITGSCGKTTTKEILAAILSEKYNIIANEGNLNSETGLPLSVFKIKKEHQVGIFEMGMNRRGEILELANVLFPQFAIITNIGTAHIGILGTQDAIAEEKKNIFSNFSSGCVGFIPEDDKYASFLAKDILGDVVLFGDKQKDCKNVTDLGLNGTSFVFKNVQMCLSLPGYHNFSNAMGAISVASFLGLTPDQIKSGLNKIESLFGRSQVLKLSKNTVLLDCYNANPDSMEKALDLCDEVSFTKNVCDYKIYVLGDMLELGDCSKIEHEKIGMRCDKSNANVIVLVGQQIQCAKPFIKNKKIICCENIDDNSTKNCASSILQNMTENTLILFKGSRGIQLERIYAILEKYDHASCKTSEQVEIS